MISWSVISILGLYYLPNHSLIPISVRQEAITKKKYDFYSNHDCFVIFLDYIRKKECQGLK